LGHGGLQNLGQSRNREIILAIITARSGEFFINSEFCASWAQSN